MAAGRPRLGHGVRPNAPPSQPTLSGPQFFPTVLGEEEEEHDAPNASGSGQSSSERAQNGEDGQKPAEAVKPRAPQDPVQPTRCEVIEHNLTHLPYRSWCPHCVNGHGKTLPHFSQDPDEMYQVPMVSVDRHFMGTKEDEEKSQPILATKDRESRKVFAQVVPSKGASHPYPVKALLQNIDNLGHTKIILCLLYTSTLPTKRLV